MYALLIKSLLIIPLWGCVNISFAQSIDTIDIRQELLRMDIPLLEIQTVDNIEPTCDQILPPPGCWGAGITNATKVPGRLRITYGGNIIFDTGEYNKGKSGMTLKIRGNTSAYMKIKPYKIKLQKSADLFFRGDYYKYADKDYLLVVDQNFYRKVGFKVNEIVGLQWTPHYQYVNVMINGDYRGLYMLLESVSRNERSRINVDKTGFIFEYDPYWWNEDVYVVSPTPLPWPMHYTFKYPDSDDITDDELCYFRDMIEQVEKSIYDGSYPDYIDVNSFASWMIGHDILGNNDGAGSNIFLTKRDNTDSTKVMMANMWDFDWIFYRDEMWDAAHDYFFFPNLFNNVNGAFKDAYVDKWNEIKDYIFEELILYLDNFADTINVDDYNKSIKFTNDRWGGAYESVQVYVDRAKTWLNKRHNWLSEAILDLENSTGIKEVNVSGKFDEKDVYYNMLGQKVNKPNTGIYIRNGEKVLVK